MLPRSLLGRLMLAAVAGVLAAGLTATVVILLWPRSQDARMRMELGEALDKLERAAAIDANGRMHIRLHAKYSDIYDAMPRDAAYQVRNGAGRILAQSDPGPALMALKAWRPGNDDVILRGGAMPVRLRLAERIVEHAGRPLVLRVARSDRLVSRLDDYAGTLYMRAGLVTVLLALVTFSLVVFFTVRRLVSPLRHASEVAAGIGPRTLSTRLDLDAMPSELVPLVDAFNAALNRLENGYRVQRDFLASAAHELKTPLALLRAEIELGGTANPHLLLRDTALMARQVHQLLHLAEVSEGHNYSFSEIELRAVLAEATNYMARLAEQNAVYLALEASDETQVPVEADEAAVFVLAKNLLENALQHSPRGGVVRVGLDAHGFWVEDEGAGVAEADRSALFKRFWRGRRDGDGAGLGLSICQEICLAHGWKISLAPRDEERGARFEVLLPNGAPGGHLSTRSP